MKLATRQQPLMRNLQISTLTGTNKRRLETYAKHVNRPSITDVVDSPLSGCQSTSAPHISGYLSGYFYEITHIWVMARHGWSISEGRLNSPVLLMFFISGWCHRERESGKLCFLGRQRFGNRSLTAFMSQTTSFINTTGQEGKAGNERT